MPVAVVRSLLFRSALRTKSSSSSRLSAFVMQQQQRRQHWRRFKSAVMLLPDPPKATIGISSSSSCLVQRINAQRKGKSGESGKASVAGLFLHCLGQFGSSRVGFFAFVRKRGGNVLYGIAIESGGRRAAQLPLSVPTITHATKIATKSACCCCCSPKSAGRR